MGIFLTSRDTCAPTYFTCPLLLECTKKGLYSKISCLTFWHRRCFWEDSTCHVPNIVRLPDTRVLYLIGEFSYPVWNIATNEQSWDRPRDWWSDQVAASISSNEQHFFPNILQNSPEPVNFHSCTVHLDNIVFYLSD